ncbi:MAG TPA: rRNA small subunit methyltransferase B, partial [Humibacter sp.]|nr:rRNA small subunit methyltransferase B [Humibacter sp.]
SRLQAALIDSAVKALKPGGLLCYVTCSPHLAETRVAVSDALKRHPDALRELPTRDVAQSIALEPLDLAGDPAQVQLWPHRHGTDAMFIALLEKI